MVCSMRLSEFDYQLPPELIAQEPTTERDASRLLVLSRASGQVAHRTFSDLPEHFRAGDLLIVNDTKVIPARLFGTFEDGKSVEVLLVRPVKGQTWEALVKPAKLARVGRKLLLACGHLAVTVAAQGIYGHRILRLPVDVDLRGILRSYGVTPLPPYIKRRAESREPRKMPRVTALGSRPPRGYPALISSGLRPYMRRRTGRWPRRRPVCTSPRHCSTGSAVWGFWCTG